jgi:hypothetical protein
MNWLILAGVTANLALTGTLVLIAAKAVKKVQTNVDDLETATADALEIVAQGLRKK